MLLRLPTVFDLFYIYLKYPCSHNLSRWYNYVLIHECGIFSLVVCYLTPRLNISLTFTYGSQLQSPYATWIKIKSLLLKWTNRLDKYMNGTCRAVPRRSSKSYTINVMAKKWPINGMGDALLRTSVFRSRPMYFWSICRRPTSVRHWNWASLDLCMTVCERRVIIGFHEVSKLHDCALTKFPHFSRHESQGLLKDFSRTKLHFSSTIASLSGAL